MEQRRERSSSVRERLLPRSGARAYGSRRGSGAGAAVQRPDGGTLKSTSTPWARLGTGGAALAVTMSIGVWMRWHLAGAVALPSPFTYVRHAHAHLGYYGVLFPLAWLAWESAGTSAAPRALTWAYWTATIAAVVGFWDAGYSRLATGASAVVGGIWLVRALALVPRMGRTRDLLGAVPLGVVASLACVPLIALNMRSDPATAQGFVGTFLSAILFLVVTPSAFSAYGQAATPWPLWLVSGSATALALGTWVNPWTRAGMCVHALVLGVAATGARVPLHVRVAWAPVAGGVAALATGAVDASRPVLLAGTHFIVLGPLLAMLLEPQLKIRVPAWAWLTGHAATAAMAAAIAAIGVIPGAGVAAAWTGTLTAAWWLGLLLASGRGASGDRANTPGDRATL